MSVYLCLLKGLSKVDADAEEDDDGGDASII